MINQSTAASLIWMSVALDGEKIKQIKQKFNKPFRCEVAATSVAESAYY